VSLTSADIADAVVTSSSQLLVNGKTPGTISMYVWERTGGLRRYEVEVQRDLAVLNDQIKRLFPGESIEAQSSGKGIVLSGLVNSKETFDKAAIVAGGFVDKADAIVNMLRIQESTASNQVLLKVRFAEVTRSAVTDLGVTLFTGANGYKDVLARTTTTTPAPVFDNSNPGQPKLVFSDFLNLFFFDTKHQLGAAIQALQTKGQFQMLAEPNVVAESGKEASFLAGGEFPVPVAQGSGANLAISVSYKEFGVRLNFTPVIHSDRVHLKVRPEVSTLDFANGVLLNGFRIPALSTRRTETEVDLMDGQTFAIAGLINNSMNSTLQKIPGIGDIPILGLLFKSKAANKDQTELVVMITPQLAAEHAGAIHAAAPACENGRSAAGRLYAGARGSHEPARGNGAGRSEGCAVRRACSDVRVAGQLSGGRCGHPESAATACRRGRTENGSVADSGHCACGGQCHRTARAGQHAAARERREVAEREGTEEAGRGQTEAGEGRPGAAGKSRARAGEA